MPRLPLLAALFAAVLPAAPAAAQVTDLGPLGPSLSPRAVLPGGGGDAVVLSASPAEREGRVAVHVVRNARAAGRVIARGELVDWAPVGPMRAHVLVRRGERLVLLRASDRGLDPVWAVRASAASAAVAHGDGGRAAVAWTSAPVDPRLGRSRWRLQLVTSGDGRRFSRPRRTRGVLPTWLDDLTVTTGLGLALDARGRPVVGVTAWRRAGAVLVLATVGRGARPVARQVFPGLDGLVDVGRTPRGRVVALVEDTGIEGQVGECVSNRNGRRVWATVREPGELRFGSARRLEQRQLVCADQLARIVTGPGERVAIAWSIAYEGDPPAPPAVRLAFAEPGAGFGPVRELWNGRALGDATFVARGDLRVASHAPRDPYTPLSGALGVATLIPGAAEPEAPHPVDDDVSHGTVAAPAPEGGAVLAWIAPGRRLRLLRTG
jgi:hypothetical protein